MDAIIHIGLAIISGSLAGTNKKEEKRNYKRRRRRRRGERHSKDERFELM
jgi:hypothetical protein